MTQAELSRHVRGIVKALQAAGLTVTGAKVTFAQGTPVIEVSTAESITTAASAQGGVNVQDFQEALRGRHAARRP